MTFTIMKSRKVVVVDKKGVETEKTLRIMNDIQVLDSLLFTLAPLWKMIDVQKTKSAWDGKPETEEQHKAIRMCSPSLTGG